MSNLLEKEIFDLDQSGTADHDHEEEDRQKRARWSRKTDYLLSLIGFSVGLGNLWRFPYVCNRNGGGAFLIPFIFFLVVCGLPLFFLEVALGQFSGKSTVPLWDICPLFRGIGYGMNLVPGLTTLYYNIIIAWAIYYMVRSCSSVLPWTSCNNWWNTDLCEDLKSNVTLTHISNTGTQLNATTVAYNVDLSDEWKNMTLSHTAAEEFWQYNALRISGGLSEVGQIQWHLALCLLGAWVIVFFCLIKGVRSVGKVVYVTALLPYVLLLALLIRGLTMPGAVDGVIFYLKPNFSKLLEIQVWLEACLQVFYSLGPAYGGLVTLSSYNDFHNNCLRDSIVVALISEGTSLFGGLVIFTVLGFMAQEANVPISDVVSSGPGLGFVAYPEALSQLPVPQAWSFLFFVMILTVGLDSQFANVEVVITSIVDAFPSLLGKRRTLATASYCILAFVIGLPFCTEGGIYIFQLADWYIASIAVVLIGVLEALIIGWIYGAERFGDDVELMLGRRPPVVIKILLCYVTPLLLFLAFIITMAQYKPPTYGKYEYPPYAQVIGWFIASISVIPIPVVMVREILTAKGSFMERIRQTVKPSPKWLPAHRSYRAMYIEQTREQAASSTFEKCFHLCQRS